MARIVGGILLAAVVGCSGDDPSPSGGRAAPARRPPASAGPDGGFEAVAAAIASGRAPAEWGAAVARVGSFADGQGNAVAASATLALDGDFELRQFSGAAGRGSRGLVVAMRRSATTPDLEPVAVASLPALSLLDGLTPIGSEEYAPGKTRQLVLLLDGMLRAALLGGTPPVSEFLSVEGPPWRGGEWPEFLAEPPVEVARIASVRSFAVRAQAPFALLAAARIDLIDTPLDGSEAGSEPRGRDCLVLYRTADPTVSGTLWGVAWIMDVTGPEPR